MSRGRHLVLNEHKVGCASWGGAGGPGRDTLARVRLSLYEFRTGVETIGGNRIVYDVAQGQASFGAATVDGHALVWQLDRDEPDGALLSRPVRIDPFARWVARCDRVDFPKGGVAWTHTHPGPGIRYLLHGELEVRTDGRSAFYGAGGAWFESGPEPVYAEASPHLETAFVRVLLLPEEWMGKRTITYVNPADRDRPRLQRATVFCEHAVTIRD
jgi:quercetin dioxygenase-like cupin family protein